MRSLFICVTQFQVLAALSFMKAPENEGKVVDLVLVPPIAQETRWLTWLKAVGCFARIYRLASAYTKLIEKRDVLHPKKFQDCYYGYQDYLLGLGKKKRVLTRVLSRTQYQSTEAVRLSDYHQIIFGSPNPLTQELISIVRRVNPMVELYGLDEGLGSYLPRAFEMYPELKGVYLFESELARVKFPVFPLGKLDRPEMHSVWDAMNQAFGDVLPEIHPGMLFFDQWLDMPWTQDLNPQDWKSRPYICYKDHLIDELRSVFSQHAKGLMYVPHPLQTKEATDHYRAQGFEVLNPECPFPFEFNWFNPKNKAALESQDPFWCLTVYSSAVVMPFITMSQPKDLRAVFLMECFKEAKVIDHYGIDDSVYDLLERIVARYPESIFMPKTEAELESLFH